MIAIVKYKGGNIQSVTNAIDRLGYKYIITNSPELLKTADKVIFPGVGQASVAHDSLMEKGLADVLFSLQQPVLGICLGLQLMCRFTEEGNTNGLGVYSNTVRRFPTTGIVPHMGWNTVTTTDEVLFKNIPQNSHFYFVHSYYAEINENSIANCDYILPFSAAMKKNNFYAVQFHPEKSGENGEKLLKNFLEL